ncbi:hypothetical protein PR202_gb07952 [Eleusine coracana subsp. coracana]|uniref:DUF3444 domain-containing protein n=1 Tax=Eleusine coracana subsp. coracana TaxID=191504 RepID=A0AAV5EE98_ELECO|nr:hypothetical protein PR202_gb07952 [Eleusine coracana subsp. coracana]
MSTSSTTQIPVNANEGKVEGEDGRRRAYGFSEETMEEVTKGNLKGNLVNKSNTRGKCYGIVENFKSIVGKFCRVGSLKGEKPLARSSHSRTHPPLTSAQRLRRRSRRQLGHELSDGDNPLPTARNGLKDSVFELWSGILGDFRLKNKQGRSGMHGTQHDETSAKPDSAPTANDKADERVASDTGKPDISHQQNLGRGVDTSAEPGATGISSPRRSSRRKECVDSNNILKTPTKKRRTLKDWFSNDTPTSSKVFGDKGAGADGQATDPHVSNKTNNQEKGSTEGSERNNKNEFTNDTTAEKPCNVGNFLYPDSEFCDFDARRDASLFAVGQIWALYDDLDGMPRYYARIRHLDTYNFRVQYTWLEHDAANNEEDKWTDNQLPVACGNYVIGKTELDGYITVFRPDKDGNILEAPSKEYLRFSHQIPSFRLTKEQGGQLCGFFELDPASFPDPFLSGGAN